MERQALEVMAAEHQYVRGIRANLHQFIQQAIQVFFVGLVIGMERNVLPVLSQDFGVPKGSFLFLMSFVVSFGFVKGILNFVAGRLSERIGRKKVLLLGWLGALPIPFMILYAQNWGWIVAANVFLGINQGFAWSMTVTSKVDITRAEQRGFATGVNEFAGYAAVGLGGACDRLSVGSLWSARSACRLHIIHNLHCIVCCHGFRARNTALGQG